MKNDKKQEPKGLYILWTIENYTLNKQTRSGKKCQKKFKEGQDKTNELTLREILHQKTKQTKFTNKEQIIKLFKNN